MYTRTGRSSRASEAVAEEADEGADGDVSAHADGASRRGRRGMWGFAVAFRGPPRLGVARGTPTGTDATPDAIDMAPAPADKRGPAGRAPWIKVRYPVGRRQTVRPEKANFSIFRLRIFRRCHHSNPRVSLPRAKSETIRARSSELGAAVGDGGGSRSGRRGAVRGFRSITSRSVGFARDDRASAAHREEGTPPVGQQNPTRIGWVKNLGFDPG